MADYTYACCKCCAGIAMSDHEQHGGTVPQDGHDGPCSTCKQGSEDRVYPSSGATS